MGHLNSWACSPLVANRIHLFPTQFEVICSNKSGEGSHSTAPWTEAERIALSLSRQLFLVVSTEVLWIKQHIHHLHLCQTETAMGLDFNVFHHLQNTGFCHCSKNGVREARWWTCSQCTPSPQHALFIHWYYLSVLICNGIEYIKCTKPGGFLCPERSPANPSVAMLYVSHILEASDDIP